MAELIETLPGSEVLADPASKLIGVVEEVARELNPTRKRAAATLDSRLDRDLGIDSLGRAELVARIEHAFGVSLPERILAQAETPRDLLAAALASQSATTAEPYIAATAPAIPIAAAQPVEARSLCAVLDWHVERHPDRPHIILEEPGARGTTLSYAALAAKARHAARGLRELQIAAGESRCHHAADERVLLRRLLRRALCRRSAGSDLPAGAGEPDRGSPPASGGNSRQCRGHHADSAAGTAHGRRTTARARRQPDQRGERRVSP
jgi:acyl carrier protein